MNVWLTIFSVYIIGLFIYVIDYEVKEAQKRNNHPACTWSPCGNNKEGKCIMNLETYLKCKEHSLNGWGRHI